MFVCQTHISHSHVRVADEVESEGGLELCWGFCAGASSALSVSRIFRSHVVVSEELEVRNGCDFVLCMSQLATFQGISQRDKSYGQNHKLSLALRLNSTDRQLRVRLALHRLQPQLAAHLEPPSGFTLHTDKPPIGQHQLARLPPRRTRHRKQPTRAPPQRALLHRRIENDRLTGQKQRSPGSTATDEAAQGTS